MSSTDDIDSEVTSLLRSVQSNQQDIGRVVSALDHSPDDGKNCVDIKGVDPEFGEAEFMEEFVLQRKGSFHNFLRLLSPSSYAVILSSPSYLVFLGVPRHHGVFLFRLLSHGSHSHSLPVKRTLLALLQANTLCSALGVWEEPLS